LQQSGLAAALLFSTSTIFDDVIGDIGVLAKQALICWKQISSKFHAISRLSAEQT
jgi:hypothetical protein